MSDHPKIACGVFSAVDFRRHPVFPLLYWGLRAQNHRGHQSHGFLTYNGGFHVHKGLDLVPKIKEKEVQTWLTRLPGHVGIGNVRYTTSGKTDELSLQRGTQPFLAKAGKWKVATSFNGNVVNTAKLRKEICKVFPGFSYECDAELICRKLLVELLKEGDLASAVRTCMNEIEGAFSVSGITQDGRLFAFKDPHGIRKPLGST